MRYGMEEICEDWHRFVCTTLWLLSGLSTIGVTA